MDEQMIRLGFDLLKSDRKRLQKIADAENTSVSSIARRFLKHAISQYEKEHQFHHNNKQKKILKEMGLNHLIK